MNNLNTSIDNQFIFSLDYLSYHTKCILSKIVNDFIYGDETLDFLYLEENIFGVWSTKVVMTALDELIENDIMCIDTCDCEECQNQKREEEILFNSKFIDDACPYIGVCPCCAPKNKVFNILYN